MPAVAPPTPDSPWLDPVRFASRCWLDGARLQHLPIDADAGRGDLVAQVQARWAASLGVASTDLAVCPTDLDAYRLVLGALVVPNDVVLVAEPAPAAAITALLGLGGRYLDVGRRADGSVSGAAVVRALQAWPAAAAVVEAPSLFGTDDRVWVPDREQDCVASPASIALVQPRALVVDALHAAGWGAAPWRGGTRVGAPAQTSSLAPAPALATLIALRDPDAPADPIAVGIVCAPGTGAGLLLLQGQPRWPEPSLQHALAVLRGLALPGFVALADADHAARRAQALAALAGRPGVVTLPCAGWRQAFECLGGDAAVVAKAVRGQVRAIDALSAHPGRSLAVVDLAAAAYGAR
ncbi:MAG: hypothetical protein EXR79_03625 [Myxococcales bacterium]|nr:hypothetical protein [Myxococcales bacterium]